MNATVKYLGNYFTSSFFEEYDCQWVYLDDLIGNCYNVPILKHNWEIYSGGFFYSEVLLKVASQSSELNFIFGHSEINSEGEKGRKI